MARLLAVFLLGLAAVLPARAQTIRMYVDADTVAVGDRFDLVIAAEHTGRFSPLFIDSVQIGQLKLGDFEVVRVRTRGSRLVNPGVSNMQVDSIVYEATTFALDTAAVADVPVFFTTQAEGDTVQALAPGFVVPVRSLVPEDASDVQDLAPIVEFPGPIWPFILAALALLALVLLVYYFFFRNRQQEIDVPEPPVRVRPYDSAIERLNALESVDLSEEPAIKPYYIDLSETLRVYLGEVLRLPTLEQTTRELVHDLEAKAGRHAGRVPNEAPAQVRRVLELADFVKFADYQPPPEAGREALQETRAVLDAVEREHQRWRAAEREAMQAQTAETS